MDTRQAFLGTAQTLLRAYTELSHFRIVGNTTIIGILSVNVTEKDQYPEQDTPAIHAMRKITPAEFNSYSQLYNESSIIISYSWLDAFLSELEEALFLHDPMSLGESIPVKLGKILSLSSIEELIHDIAKRRTREKGQWGLKNRIVELKDRHKLTFTISEGELEWMSNLRNSLIHNRRTGEYKSAKGQVRYEISERIREQNTENVANFLSLSFQLISELYAEGAKAIGISSRFPKHRKNLELIYRIQRSFPKFSPDTTPRCQKNEQKK
jgi:hypothetical protein